MEDNAAPQQEQKRGRGRPRLSEEEKARRAAEREAAKREQQGTAVENHAAPIPGKWRPSKPKSQMTREERAEAIESRKAHNKIRMWGIRREEVALREEATPRPIGRPLSSYTQERAIDLCAWVMEGKSVAKWCRANNVGMDSYYRWLNQRPEFRELIAAAHQNKADTLADELLDIVDDAPANITREQVEVLRLRLDARKWIAAKLRPRVWGDQRETATASQVSINIGIPNVTAVVQPVQESTVIDAKPLIDIDKPAD